MRTPVDIYFLRVNAQPAKVQLSQLAASWANYYINYLLKVCLARADSITAFVNKMDAFLSAKPPAEDPDNEDSSSNSEHVGNSNDENKEGGDGSNEHETDEKKDVDSNKEALYKFMTYIRDVKIANEPIRQLMGPIHEQVRHMQLL